MPSAAGPVHPGKRHCGGLALRASPSSAGSTAICAGSLNRNHTRSCCSESRAGAQDEVRWVWATKAVQEGRTLDTHRPGRQWGSRLCPLALGTLPTSQPLGTVCPQHCCSGRAVPMTAGGTLRHRRHQLPVSLSALWPPQQASHLIHRRPLCSQDQAGARSPTGHSRPSR